DLAADPGPRVGSARHRDVPRRRDANNIPHHARVVLRDRAQYHAGRIVDRPIVPARRRLSRREPLADLPARHRAGCIAVHLHRAADLGGRRMVFAGGGGDGVGRVWAGLPDQQLLRERAIRGDLHRDDLGWHRGISEQRPGAHRRRLHDAMARARARPRRSAVSAVARAGAVAAGRHGAKGAIRIDKVDKVYYAREGPVQAVSECSLDIRGGEICMIVGPSGCGKTTLLNAIAGFHDISGGAIYLDGEMLCGPDKPKAEPGPDRVVVFQNGALFPWKTNLENVAFGPVVQRKLTPRQAAEKARGMMVDAGLAGVEHNYPGEVSSGMRRRVEIVRALMNDPKVLLLDEPFRALDSLTKSVMHEALLEIYYKNKVTIFFITHDLEEAIFLGHRVAIMTTRPCRPKKILNVDIPHPRNYSVLTSPRFRELMEETVSAVHEEAVKAFEAGEKEM